MEGDFHVGKWTVQPALNCISGECGTHRLEPKIMRVLVCLAEHAPQVVGKEHLLRRVWPDTFVSDDVLTRSISTLRRVFRDCFLEPAVIQTIPKGGYRLIAKVEPRGETEVREERAIRSLVVLPLRWVAGSTSSRFCADEVTDAITTELAKIPALHVVSQTTAFNYRERTTPLREIAGELGVDAVMEGSVAIVGSRVRVTVQLIDGSSDCHLWAECYEHSSRHTLKAQNRIAHDIAHAIQARIGLRRHGAT